VRLSPESGGKINAIGSRSLKGIFSGIRMEEINEKQCRNKKGSVYNLKTRKVAVAELLPFLRKETVLDLCKQCPNFDNLWSCPPSVPDFEKFSARYNYADVFLFWAETGQFSAEEDPTIACYQFLKKKNRKYMLKLEEEKSGRAVFSFSCDLCAKCRKKEGEPCKKPKELRFNLTAFGFMIEDLSKVLMNHQISWSKDKNEAQYITQVSFLLYA
jgi:predicted metal-binding protein